MNKLKCCTNKKFTVIKDEDIEKYLTEDQRNIFMLLSLLIREGRHKDGKSDNNEYLIINTDEPYSNEIIDILKKNGHWN